MMKLIRGIKGLKAARQPACVASIGNYDGVHKGHQHVIATLVDHAHELGLPATVVTFEPLPKEFFAPGSVVRLTTLEQRARLLGASGVDYVLCIEFDDEFAAYSPQQFVKEVLVEGLGVRYLSVGDDFRFGRDRLGDFTVLTKLGLDYGFHTAAHETYTIDGERVSSGRVRKALAIADFVTAEKLLGRAFSICGQVQKGQQLGRTINYPTANLVFNDFRAPLSGVFAVRTHWQGMVLDSIANLGTRPTVDGGENRLEVHIFCFEDDLYGQEIEIEFVAKIRDEKRFETFEDLKRQIQKDVKTAHRLLKEP